ncbi:unnamed protein product, partial [Owenia fusiformis]
MDTNNERYYCFLHIKVRRVLFFGLVLLGIANKTSAFTIRINTTIAKDSTIPTNTSIHGDTTIERDSIISRDTTIPRETTIPKVNTIQRDSTKPTNTSISRETTIPRDSAIPTNTSTISRDITIPRDSAIPISTIIHVDTTASRDTTRDSYGETSHQYKYSGENKNGNEFEIFKSGDHNIKHNDNAEEQIHSGHDNHGMLNTDDFWKDYFSNNKHAKRNPIMGRNTGKDYRKHDPKYNQQSNSNGNVNNMQSRQHLNNLGSSLDTLYTVYPNPMHDHNDCQIC